jgi:Holliday junction resolvase RusA-like endonuclease
MTRTASDAGVDAACGSAKDGHDAVPFPPAVPAPASDHTSRDISGQMPLPVASDGTTAGAPQGEGEAPTTPRGDAILTITAYGTPITQGSIRSLGKGRPSVHSNAKTLKPWRQAVKQAAADVMLTHDQLDGPVRVDLLLCFARPAAHWRSGRNAHLLRDRAPFRPITRATGDIDKLARAILDALGQAGVYVDDSQVVDVRARKVWAGDEEALRHPGVHITVREVTR